MSKSKVIDVVAAVIVKEGKVFATQRGPGMLLPGKWEFPGGKVEDGEQGEIALRREIQEELQCRIDVGDKVTTTEYLYDFGTIRLTSFWAKLIDEWPVLTEHQESRWLSSAGLHSVEWAPADLPAVDIVAERLNR
ncbi:(deoxy)nucleoside triphosphate pyrophosphohydrolase [Corynebacterium guangdongense]|uniref:8-oxo-dGTP diphosphatase n=1 Tax=Corynebacterium guangdongense TaxID=1783348 RepID=A0ABU1ZVV3_9CORY|nr:(deoxy)nucleoside triphosphate pyrophosphohydrolase [Corynebacterium guangdongense]MDR7329061.1 8-oxo-dGTP diphosphatase [Corynebacterium guangdongense]